MRNAQFVPAQVPGSKSTLVVLHGRGDSSAGFKWLPGALNLPHLNYLLLNAPDEWGPSFAPGYSWYDRPPNQAPGIVRSRKLLFALLAELQEQHGLQSSDIGLLGFSQGCLMCIDVGLRWPHRLAGVVGISGYVFFEDEYPRAFSAEAKNHAWLITHGTHDDLLPIAHTAPQIKRLISFGVPMAWREYDKEHTIDQGRELADIRTFLTSVFNLGQ